MLVEYHRELCLGALLFALSAQAVSTDGLCRTVAFPAPGVSLTPEGLTRVALPGCEPDVQTARPVLPAAGVSFEIPAGLEVAAVAVTPGALLEIPLAAPIEWGLPPLQPGEAMPAVLPDPAIYEAAAPYPDYARPVWRADPLRETTLLSVRVYPIRFDPARKVLLAAASLTVSVELREAQPPDLPFPRRAALSTPLSPSPLASGEAHTYVVLSTSNLLYNAPAPWNFQALCAARARAGFTPALVATEWLYANYAGANPAAKIRAFVQDAHQQWGLRYLLIGGTFDLVPAQKLYVSFMDLIVPRTTEIPSDAIYYGCLDGSYDANGNGRYGEVTDGANGGDVDLTAEVMVGRFPVADSAELAHMVRKTLRYESATAQDLEPNAFVAEKMDLGKLVYATGFMEELRYGSTAYYVDSLGFETSPYAAAFNTDNTLYDSDAYLWTTADGLAFLNRNYQTVNHIGHGATKQCMKIALTTPANQSALRAFTNSMPYFVYSQTCSAGAFDTPDCFAEQLVTVSNAACAAVMNAREGWEYSGTVGGFSQRFHRCFWDAALRNNATRLGEINDKSRRMHLYLLSPTSANYWRWVYYELNLFGDPATPFAAAVNTTPPAITCTPLPNTYDTQTAYRVTCTLEPVGIYDPDSPSLVWQTDREPGVLRTQSLTQVEGNLYESLIAPQPAHTRVAYALHARNLAGVAARWPATNDAVFCVTERLDLDIRGSPFNYGTATPDYGIHHFASGLVAVASAPDLFMVDDNTRFHNVGFFGAGSAPASGASQSVSFRIDTSSLLVWTWQREHLLTFCADNRAFPTQTFWGVANTAMSVPPAPETVTNGYAFAEWRLDGLRAPAAPGYCPPAFGELLMGAPHTLEARYLPVDLDADGNAIPDWWELRYFGANGQNPEADGDGDGYALLEEYQDRSSPLAAGSIPAPPLIAHTPLAEVQTRPGPFTLQAEITDTRAVDSAAVRWRRRAEAWQLTPMLPVSNTLFAAQIGAASAPGDDFEYQILASDPSGMTSQTDLSFFFLKYPAVDASRFHDLAYVALPTQTIVSQYMNLYNTGNADLVWTMRFARVESILETNLPCWDRRSLGQAWHASTNRSASTPYALYSRLVSGAVKNAPVRSTVTMPPVLIGQAATLSFKYWIHSEPYLSTARTFDGGIVEFSADGGATFQQLKGPYTHTIYGWTASPWPDGTPCLAGDGSEGWRAITFDLLKEYPEMNGFRDRVLSFRFHYGGDDNTDNEGWYIDDITVQPLQWQQGFSHNLESTYNYTVAAGDYKRILWCNLPASMELRDDNVTVFVASNDPVTPLFSFYWQLKIRDYPRLPGLAAAQTATGDGLVSLSTGVYDCDGEPVGLAVQWSPDSGRTWSAAALTDVLTSVGTVPPAAPDGLVAGLPTLTNAVPLTNWLSAAWASRLIAPPLTVNTQVVFRVTATNGYFGKTFTTARLTVDNVPPSFLPGALALAPLSTVGPYALTTNLLGLAWPAAVDTPSGNGLCYRLSTSFGGTSILSQTSTSLAASNRLDATHSYHVVALDPAGNASAPLTASLLVLDAAGDYDGDGMTTADEETAGTLATDPAQCFTVALRTLPDKPGMLTLAWDSAAGRRYAIEATPTLLPPAWQPLPGYTDIPGTGAPLEVSLPDGQPSQFFRLRVYNP